MKHATNKQTSSSWIVLIFVLLLMNFNTGLAAKPDCNVNPSHPSCNDGGGAALDAYTLNDGSCAAAEAELFGDTRDLGGGGTGYQHCQNTMAGSNVPNNTKSLFTDFQRCILGMTLSGVGSEILLVKASFNSLRNKNTGDIFAVSLFFEDDNGVKYESDTLPIPFLTSPDPAGYTLQIDGTATVYTQGKGKNRAAVGEVCVDTVIYEPVP